MIHLKISLLGVGRKPPKSKFRMDSEELTCSLIQIHNNCNRRNLHARVKQLLVPRGGPQDESHSSQDRVSFL